MNSIFMTEGMETVGDSLSPKFEHLRLTKLKALMMFRNNLPNALSHILAHVQ